MYRIEDCNEPHAHENPRNQRYGMYAQGAGCTHLCTLTLRIRTDQHQSGLSACGLTYTRAAVASRRAAPPRTLAERPRSKRLTPTRCARRHLAAAASCSRSTARRSRCAGSCAWAAARAPARAQGADAGRAERWHQTASGRCVRAGEGAARRGVCVGSPRATLDAAARSRPRLCQGAAESVRGAHKIARARSRGR